MESNKYIDVLSYLPSFYRDNNNINNIKILNYIIGGELKELDDTTSAFKYHRVLSDKASYGIDKWEEEFGIDNKSLSDADRYKIIKGLLNGSGRTTKQKLKEIIKSTTGQDVNIDESPESHCFTIEFLNGFGTEATMKALERILNDVLPAHLCYNYTFVANHHRPQLGNKLTTRLHEEITVYPSDIKEINLSGRVDVSYIPTQTTKELKLRGDISEI